MSELSAEKLAELRKTAEWEPVVPWTWANGGVFFSSAFGLQPLTLPGSSSQFIAAFDPPTALALLDRIEELEGELAGYRKREAGQVYEYGVRYGGDHMVRRFSSRERAVYHLDAEFGDKLIRRIGVRRIVAGEWEEVENE